MINLRLKNRNNTAIYCRLSVDDGINQKSQSLTNQKSILTKYVLDQKWNLFDVYVDDGYSGTNFDRPSFKRLLTDIECGLIDIVITKDLSRLGRDYLEIGRYTEEYFPEHNIRYIALNDNVDTSNELDDFTPFKNIINEFYAKEISKKIRYTLKKQIMKGDFKKAGYPLYGYMYNEKNKRVINPQTAPNVKKIFKLFLLGYSIKRIANYLEENKILTPMAYLVSIRPNSKNKFFNQYTWNLDSIKRLLKNQEYCGHYIRGKTTKGFKSYHTRCVPLEKQYIFENVFDSIISQETFDFAQTMFAYKIYGFESKNPFAGLAFCGTCGKPLKLLESTGTSDNDKKLITCIAKDNAGKGIIILNELEKFIKTELIILKEVVIKYEEEFFSFLVNCIKKSKIVIPIFQEKSKEKEIHTRYNQLDKYIKSLFEYNESKPMPGNLYEKIMKEFVLEKKLLELKLKQNQLKMSTTEVKMDNFKTNYNSFIKVIKILNKDNFLEAYVIRNIISKIVITPFRLDKNMHNKFDSNITIIYKFADRYIKDFMKKKRENYDFTNENIKTKQCSNLL